MLKNVITWGIILLVLMSIFNHYGNVGSAPDELTYSDFLDNVRNGTVASVNISSTPEGNTISGKDVNGKDFHTFNTCYRDDPSYRVVAFTATQIPNIEGRRYPPELAGPRYPDGIPIEAEADLRHLVARGEEKA